jgi:hypothetical protein
MNALVIAEVTDYSQFIHALRLRAEQLNIARTTIDSVSGMPSGYAGKLLSENPIRSLGRVSFGPVLQSLGLKLLIVEDPQALERVTSRLTKRRREMCRTRPCARLPESGPMDSL